MNYRFNYKTTAFDFWQLSMYYTYGSIVGMCNIIFTVAMILLAVKFWGDINTVVRILLVLACCLFTVVQPLVIYLRARKQVSTLPTDMAIVFDDAGVHVETGNQISHLKWKAIKRVAKKPTMIVVFSTTTHGFLLTNKALGDQKEEFYAYLVSKIKK